MDDFVRDYSGRKIAMSEILNQVGPGWHPLVRRLIRDLRVLGWDGTLTQIKMKFGTLRFYVGASNYQILNRIIEAQKESSELCESCGRPGSVRNIGYWLRAECRYHHFTRLTRYRYRWAVEVARWLWRIAGDGTSR